MRIAPSCDMPVCPYLGALEIPMRKVQMSRKAQGPSCIALGSCSEVPSEINLMQICMRNERRQEFMILSVILLSHCEPCAPGTEQSSRPRTAEPWLVPE